MELLHSFEIDAINPHILCLREHHMAEQDLLHLSINAYQLGSSFCRKGLQKGGVCIFVKEDQLFNKIDISRHCKEQDLEICAIQLVTKSSNLIILSLYRAPSGDINEFLKRLDAILMYLYSPKSEFIICGHINMNCLNENSHKHQINSLLKTYNLSHTVSFATRVQNSSSTAIDNIFIDNARLSSSYTSPIVNGLSDHDAQFLTMTNIDTEVNRAPLKWKLRKINYETIAQFHHLLENYIRLNRYHICQICHL
jgi:exonuclease III